MYFLCYVWQTNEGKQVFMNKVLESEHPISWLGRTQTEDPKARCRLVWWQQLRKEEEYLVKGFTSDP